MINPTTNLTLGALLPLLLTSGPLAAAEADLLFAARFDSGWNADFSRGDATAVHSDRLTPVQGFQGNGLHAAPYEWIRYSLPENISLQRGTITLMVKPNYSTPNFREDFGKASQAIFAMKIRTGPMFELRLRNDKGGAALVATVGNMPDQKTDLRLPVKWNADEWHRVRVSWEAPGHLILAVDDQPEVRVDNAHLPQIPEKMLYDLYLGTNTQQTSYFQMEHFDGVIDDVQIFSSPNARAIEGALPAPPERNQVAAPAIAPRWVGEQRHRINFVVADGSSQYKNYPLMAEVALANGWEKLSFVERRDAIGSLRLVRFDRETGEPVPYNSSLQGPERYYIPFHPSEELLANGAGEVRWTHTGQAGAGYSLYYDPTMRDQQIFPPSIPMVGNGDHLRTGRWDTPGRLAVGAWGVFDVNDLDNDGDLDLWASSGFETRSAYDEMNGHYFFENLGSGGEPSDVYSQPVLITRGNTPHGYLEGQVVPHIADVNGDGRQDVLLCGRANRGWAEFEMQGGRPVITAFHPLRFKGPDPGRETGRTQFYDWNGDGKGDLLAGKLVYLNAGTASDPVFDTENPVELPVSDKTEGYFFIPVDWDGDGLTDLVSSELVQRLEWHRNIGTAESPRFAEPVELRTFDNHEIRLTNQLILLRVADWEGDGDYDLIWGSEDGWFGLLENIAGKGKQPELLQTVFLQQLWAPVDAGSICVPVTHDWDGDGDQDLIIAAANEHIGLYENRGTQTEPLWATQRDMEAGHNRIDLRAGPKGSVQGPGETGWGYNNPEVADWDGDGLPDLLVSGIWGNHWFFRNAGSRRDPILARGRLLQVDWAGEQPARPEWITFEPQGEELITVWRTRPVAIDWDNDGLLDYVTLDHEGELALYRRARAEDGSLKLLPGERIFTIEGPHSQALVWNRPPGATAGRTGRTVINIVDWNKDGLIDLILDNVNARLYLNTTSNEKPVFVDQGDLVTERLANHNAAPYITDWDGDGWHDLFMGTESGHVYYFHRAYIEGAVPPLRNLGEETRQ